MSKRIHDEFTEWIHKQPISNEFEREKQEEKDVEEE